MPPYNTQLPPPFLGRDFPLNTFLLFNAETVRAGEYSQQIQLPAGISALGGRLEIDFSADPGAGEFLLMESSFDPNGSAGYDQVPAGGDLVYGNITSGPNGANTRLSTDLQPISGSFVCVYCKTAPSNAGIKVTARITRAA
jgi:hypothetical protein